ncbi:GSCOCG00004981001-RA-CDS [Cotesia congregata]|uniref:Chloride channel CLIC-like protein 1 n=1 Tax=Cotesia congregata TaxID=51543 RepID=A0A8J2H4Y0_COTCN|nr:GSCOCG00004981001-RA-CDS [Cotesia congregata]CAG5073386.1 Similar to CLCC1: Chloride channel CLIC-like protein 1 (Bos taurus) [Cotesia congregata]
MITCNYISKILVILLISGAINCFVDPTLEHTTNRDHYIDPHSIYYNKYTQQLDVKKELQVINRAANKCECHVNSLVKKNDVPDELFSRKLVNLLLAASSFEENGNLLTSSITIVLTPKELRKLKDFSLGKLTIREIDPIISNIFKEPEISYAKNIFTSIKDLLFNVIIYKEVTLVTVVILYISWIILTTEWNLLKLILILILSIFGASFVITWLQLLREAEITLTVKQVQYQKLPIQCNPSKMTWWDKLWTAFSSGEDCRKYYEGMMENPFLQVTPAQALSHMIATCIMTPASMIGNALSDFVNNSTKHLWWPVQLIVAPLLIIGIIIIFIMILIFLAGGTLSWGFGPFSIFSIRGATDSRRDGNLPSTDRQPIQPIYNFNLHGGHIHEIAIKNTDENSTSVDVKSTPAPGTSMSCIQGPVKINVINSSNSSLENSEESGKTLDKVEEISEKEIKDNNDSNGDDNNKNDECICKKKSNPVSESGDS